MMQSTVRERVAGIEPLQDFVGALGRERIVALRDECSLA
jgi:hypothetical protein